MNNYKCGETRAEDMMGHMTPTDDTARFPACRKPSVRDIDVQGHMGQMLCIGQEPGRTCRMGEGWRQVSC